MCLRVNRLWILMRSGELFSHHNPTLLATLNSSQFEAIVFLVSLKFPWDLSCCCCLMKDRLLSLAKCIFQPQSNYTLHTGGAQWLKKIWKRCNLEKGPPSQVSTFNFEHFLCNEFPTFFVNKVGHLLSELCWIPRFRDLTNKITKQNSIAGFDFNSDRIFQQ